MNGVNSVVNGVKSKVIGFKRVVNTFNCHNAVILSGLSPLNLKIASFLHQFLLNCKIVKKSIFFLIETNNNSKSNSQTRSTALGNTSTAKKRWAFPESPNPPPHGPNSDNLVLFFSEVEIQDLKVILELRILYNVIYCIYAI